MGNSASDASLQDNLGAMTDDQKAALQTQYSLSSKQMSQIDAEFQDLSKKGGISRNKFVGAFTGAGLGAEFAGILFDSFDLDGNKKMTINEWYALMGLRMGGSAEDRMKASFKLFDKNGDGELSRDELTEVISLVEFHKQYYEFLVAGRILNNGGKVRLRQQTDKTATEFVNKFFNDADTNNSNSIDIDEFVTALSKDSKALATLNLFAQGR